MKAFAIILSGVILMVITACSRPYTATMKENLKSRSIETRTENLMPLKFEDDPFKFSINEDNPVFQTESGKSYVALVELPPYQEGRALQFKSICECFGFRKSIYIPNVLVLDENHQPLKYLNFQTRPQTMWDGASYEGFSRIAPQDRFLFIYSDPTKYGKPADNLSVPYTYTTTEYRSYTNTQVTTYHTSSMGLWWRGSAVGSFKLRIIDAAKLEKEKNK